MLGCAKFTPQKYTALNAAELNATHTSPSVTSTLNMGNTSSSRTCCLLHSTEYCSRGRRGSRLLVVVVVVSVVVVLVLLVAYTSTGCSRSSGWTDYT